MAADAVTRIDMPVGSLATRVDYRYSEPTGPTPTFVHVGRELDRLANVWGTRDRGWSARCDGDKWVMSAYLGRPACTVAVTEDRDLRVALARLLGELYLVDGT